MEISSFFVELFFFLALYHYFSFYFKASLFLLDKINISNPWLSQTMIPDINRYKICIRNIKSNFTLSNWSPLLKNRLEEILNISD